MSPALHSAGSTSGDRTANDDARRLKDALEGCLAVPFTSGNRIERLRNGDEIFPAMLEAIASAKERVDLETFVYWSGEVAETFADALISAAERGVEVRVLLDAVGSLPMSAQLRARLDASRVDIRSFRPPVRWRFWNLDHRTHRKILVCDDVGFTGGVGIADEWRGDARNPYEWRESHFRIRGPAAGFLRASFVGHWLEAIPAGHVSDALAGVRSNPAQQSVVVEPHVEPAGPGQVQVIRSGAGVGWTDVEILLRALVTNAVTRLRITTAYFVPDDGLVDLIGAAAERGVQVEILNPGPHTDHRICQLAGEDIYQGLLDRGVRIRRYQPTMLHAKVITVDGILSVIGSANFNHRSLLKDDEICLTVLDRELTRTLDRDFDDDLRTAREIDPSVDWAKRGVVQRTSEWFARRIRRQL